MVLEVLKLTQNLLDVQLRAFEQSKAVNTFQVIDSAPERTFCSIDHEQLDGRDHCIAIEQLKSLGSNLIATRIMLEESRRKIGPNLKDQSSKLEKK